MVPEKQLEKIRKSLTKCKNPLFFFDDDGDGLCSYLLLRRYIDKGKCVVVKSSPVLDENFLNKVREVNPDAIFVLDKPDISQKFIDSIDVPIIWMDHHQIVKKKGVKYYNPRRYGEGVPVSYICYKIVKQDFWLGILGCVGDWFIPKEIDEFIRMYPDLLDKKVDNPGEILFSGEYKLGKLARIFSFSLKGKTSGVIKSIKSLYDVESPYEILNNDKKFKFLLNHFEKVNKEYQNLVKKVKDDKEDILLFIYPSEKMSFTGDLSNELLYRYPDKVIIIGRKKSDYIRLSFRSSKIKLPKLIEKSLEGLDGYGGGHEYACGGNINVRDFEEFLKRFKEEIKK